jgi:hypothetical protein
MLDLRRHPPEDLARDLLLRPDETLVREITDETLFRPNRGFTEKTSRHIVVRLIQSLTHSNRN